MSAELGIRWAVLFGSLGYWPEQEVNGYKTGGGGFQGGLRALFGDRRFKGHASVSAGVVGHYGTLRVYEAGNVEEQTGIIWGATVLGGGRVFFGGDGPRRLFLHFGLGASFQSSLDGSTDGVIEPEGWDSPSVAADLSFGVEVFGR